MPDASTIMPAVLGIFAAGGFLAYARMGTPFQERITLSLGLLIAAGIYVGFATARANIPWVAIESGGVAIFALFVLAARKGSILWLGFGWLLHPFWDAPMHLYVARTDVAPYWYIILCLVFDVIVGGYIVMNGKRFKGTV